MKKITLTFIICVICMTQGFGQINPIENLTWSQWYSHSYNQFVMEWDVPESTQDTLVGYNIYRGNVLYRFQTDSTLYHTVSWIPTGPTFHSNCPVDFIFEAPFWAHVTAVYNAARIESSYNDSVYVEGPLIGIDKIKFEKPVLYPNPTPGKLIVDHNGLNRILVFNLNGKLISDIQPAAQIDLSQLSQGTYFVKLISEEKTLMQKIIIEQ